MTVANEVASSTRLRLVDRQLTYEIEQFLFYEAQLLDERRWRDWFALLAEDVHYWMPARYNTTLRTIDTSIGKPDEIANIDDDLRGIDWRLKRMETGMAWTEDPPARVRHIVSNVQVRETDVAGEYEVDSNFITYRNRDDIDEDLWVGKRHDLIRKVGELDYRIARRTILLDQNVILSGNLSVFF